MLRLLHRMFVLAGTALVVACTITTDPVPVVETSPEPTFPDSTVGSLRIDWTIDGARDAVLCSQRGATAIEIAVTTEAGADAGSYQQSCASFATTIFLDPGTYTAFAVLIDPARQPLTTAAPIDAFAIATGEEVRIPIDFPSASFF